MCPDVESGRKSFVVHRQLQSAKKVTFARPLLFLFFIYSCRWRILDVSCNLNNIRGNEGNGSCGERAPCECRLDDLFVEKRPCFSFFLFPKTDFFLFRVFCLSLDTRKKTSWISTVGGRSGRGCWLMMTHFYLRHHPRALLQQ